MFVFEVLLDGCTDVTGTRSSFPDADPSVDKFDNVVAV
jgi:hypothetical protein